jgi:glycerate dehydrogenase
MKRGAVLINITSNQVLDEDALAELLKAGHLRGGGFDDLSRSGHDDELRGVRSPLLESPNVLFSPQTGWYTIEAQERLLRMVVENVENFHSGSPTNIVA